MYKLIVPALVLALAGCSSSEPQTQEDPQPVEEQTEKTAPEETEESADTETDVATLIEQAATGEHRSEKNIARNEYRNPVETLTFFGIEPDMTVVELWPGSGWYTEVLAPTLTDGKLIAANYGPKPEDPEHYRNRVYKEYTQRLKDEDVFSNTEFLMFDPPKKADLGEPESADMVLTFRNIHSFMGAEAVDTVMAESFKVLKPGGILGVVQHRADEGADVTETAKKGYVPEAYVIEKAKEAGFELVEKSEINANPKDTKDYAEGVWTLPPSYRLGDKDRAKYEAIGESDRMTLKFQKPAADDQAADDQAADDQAADDEAAGEQAADDQAADDEAAGEQAATK